MALQCHIPEERTEALLEVISASHNVAGLVPHSQVDAPQARHSDIDGAAIGSVGLLCERIVVFFIMSLCLSGG